MNKHAEEIRAEVARLRQTGEYDRFTSPDADTESSEVAETLSDAIELTDAEADAIWASLDEVKDASPEVHHDEVARAIARSQESDESAHNSAVQKDSGFEESVTRGDARALRDWFLS